MMPADPMLFENLDSRCLFTKAQLAERLVVSTRTVDRLIKKGLPAIRVGSVHRFDWSDVTRWLKHEKQRSSKWPRRTS